MSESLSPIFLRGKRVNLRPLQKEDIPKCLIWINDEEIRDFLVVHTPTTLTEEEKWLENISHLKATDVNLAIETVNGEYIGNMGIHKINWRDRVAITGTLIGEKKYWGQGLGKEAKTILLHYAFTSLNLHKISSEAIAYNERSIAYCKACGYKIEGVFRDHCFRRGQYWDLIRLGVFWEDFEPVWKRYISEKI